ncbi:NAD(P)/FAD-dependent oxidoreductase [Allorhizobium taibaishanense]|uniref:NADH:ubiquinone reductase (non-electrogenic) n=1 Tax=Allorhizobium taibaishanense TaxID=887144 RepID=A0A1Q9A6W0_9HYPH|nr:NAD(P)/FAD-dependent oxidoreductase [Allorhizobium taibaishanense]MBB4008604.1 NADH dehydrogenase [Allorhizobium taibaishanense]OLP50254.1 pyridine nucleotide-disulfide oxidoreductase [Allorhizobium taibaishanense]
MIDSDSNNRPARPHIVIVGAGFGGLACARELGRSDCAVTVVDRRNHNLFQPLLYQVATAALSPADIAEPIRKTLGRYRNIHVVMAEVTGVDAATHALLLNDGERLPYDALVIATGSDYNYFGHDEWRALAPGLKTIHEARLIRQRLLLAFERAERSDDSLERRALLTTVVIGGGPTGVELAGAVRELGHHTIKRDFRSLSVEDHRVLLVEAGNRILTAFPDHLQRYAHDYLQAIGVEIRLNARVEDVDRDGVTVNGETLRAGCVVWGAGVKASPAASWFGIAPGPGGRLPVDDRLRVHGVEDVYAIGDTALALDSKGRPLPALAQVAKQQGEYLGRALKLTFQGREPETFSFRNRGNTAVIGRNAAIFDFGRWTLKGRLAWFLWALVHVYLLINFEKRLLVTIQWISRYVTRQRGARLIDENLSP